MKKTITIFSLILVLCSCGSTKNTPQKNEDPVNIGYGSIGTDDNNYSVSKLKVDRKTAVTYTNMYDYLRGRVPGVVVRPDNTIIVRGIGTNSDMTAPLILVDGVEIDDLSSIDPLVVDSVEVLKDGSSSIYGVRGANGVILITTKK